MHPRYFIVPSPTCRHLWLSCQADIHGTGRHTGIHARLASYSTVLYGVYCTSNYRTDQPWDLNRSNGRLSCPIQLDGRVVVPSTLVYDNPSSPSRRTLYRVACETFNCIGGNGPERLSAFTRIEFDDTNWDSKSRPVVPSGVQWFSGEIITTGRPCA